MGSSGEVAKIYINEQIGDLNTPPLKDGDVVNITEGIIGKKKLNPNFLIALIEKKNIKFNEEEINLIINVKVNGKKKYMVIQRLWKKIV